LGGAYYSKESVGGKKWKNEREQERGTPRGSATLDRRLEKKNYKREDRTEKGGEEKHKIAARRVRVWIQSHIC